MGKNVLVILSMSVLVLFYQNCNELESVQTPSSDNRSISSSAPPNLNAPEEATTPPPDQPVIDDNQTITDPPEGTTQLSNCNKVLESTETDFSWTDPGQTEATIYDFWLGSIPGGKDIYDHIGNNQFNDLTLFVNNLPNDGQTIYQTLSIFRDGPNDTPKTVSCAVTAFKNINETPKKESKASLKIPSHSIAEGQFKPSTWESMTGEKYISSNNLKYFSVVNYADKWWVQAKHVPYSRGTERVIMSSALPKSNRGYRLTQTVLFKPGWKPGNTKLTGKFGFSLAGGSSQSGGKTGTDGWSVRPSWADDEIRFYLYYANRPFLVQGRNPAYGHTLVTREKYVPGKEYKVSFEVVLNSPGKKDGQFRGYINDKLVANLDNMLWMTGTPEVDNLWFSSFHGGGTVEYSPGKNVYVVVRDVIWEEL